MSDRDLEHVARVSLYAIQALDAAEVPAVAAQIAACAECRDEIESLLPVVGSFVLSPADVLRPPTPLWDRLARRIAAETGAGPPSPAPRHPAEEEWESVAPGVSVKLLATDAENERVSMLVRLAPGTGYPPHRHAGTEDMHLLDGELVTDGRKLRPGEYSRAEAGTVERRVRSETGCTCLVITSVRDTLG